MKRAKNGSSQNEVPKRSKNEACSHSLVQLDPKCVDCGAAYTAPFYHCQNCTQYLCSKCNKKQQCLQLVTRLCASTPEAFSSAAYLKSKVVSELNKFDAARQCMAESRPALIHLIALLGSSHPEIVQASLQIVHALIADKNTCSLVLLVPEVFSAIVKLIQKGIKTTPQTLGALNTILTLCTNTAPLLPPCKLLIMSGILPATFSLMKTSVGECLRQAAFMTLWNLARHPDALLALKGSADSSATSFPPLSYVVFSALQTESVETQEIAAGLLWYLAAQRECAPEIVNLLEQPLSYLKLVKKGKSPINTSKTRSASALKISEPLLKLAAYHEEKPMVSFNALCTCFHLMDGLIEYRSRIFELGKLFVVSCHYETVGVCVDHDEYQLAFCRDLLDSSYPECVWWGRWLVCLTVCHNRLVTSRWLAGTQKEKETLVEIMVILYSGSDPLPLSPDFSKKEANKRGTRSSSLHSTPVSDPLSELPRILKAYAQQALTALCVDSSLSQKIVSMILSLKENSRYETQQAKAPPASQGCTCTWCGVGDQAGPEAGAGERARQRKAYHDAMGSTYDVITRDVVVALNRSRMMSGVLKTVAVKNPGSFFKQDGRNVSKLVDPILGLSPHHIRIMGVFDPALKTLPERLQNRSFMDRFCAKRIKPYPFTGFARVMSALSSAELKVEGRNGVQLLTGWPVAFPADPKECPMEVLLGYFSEEHVPLKARPDFTLSDLASEWKTKQDPLHHDYEVRAHVIDWNTQDTTFHRDIQCEMLHWLSLLNRNEARPLTTFGPVVSSAGALSSTHFDDLPAWNHCHTGIKIWFAWDREEGRAAGITRPDEDMDLDVFLALRSSSYAVVQAGVTLCFSSNMDHRVITVENYVGVGSFWLTLGNVLPCMQRWTKEHPVELRSADVRFIVEACQIQAIAAYRDSAKFKSDLGLSLLRERWKDLKEQEIKLESKDLDEDTTEDIRIGRAKVETSQIKSNGKTLIKGEKASLAGIRKCYAQLLAFCDTLFAEFE